VWFAPPPRRLWAPAPPATLAVAAAQAQQTQSSMFTAREEWYPIVGHECPEEGCSNQVYDTYGRTTARCAAHEPF
jgi:hypothetical protein